MSDRINPAWVLACQARGARFGVVVNPQAIDWFDTYRAAAKRSNDLTACGIEHEMWLEG